MQESEKWLSKCQLYYWWKLGWRISLRDKEAMDVLILYPRTERSQTRSDVQSQASFADPSMSLRADPKEPFHMQTWINPLSPGKCEQKWEEKPGMLV